MRSRQREQPEFRHKDEEEENSLLTAKTGRMDAGYGVAKHEFE